MPETTDPVTRQHCIVCGTDKPGCTAVSVIEPGSGPSRLLYACPECMAWKDLLPLEEQTDVVGDGRLQFRRHSGV